MLAMTLNDQKPSIRHSRDQTPGRLAEIIRQCLAGDMTVDGAVVAAYGCGLCDGVVLKCDVHQMESAT
jgi:hypothetical protein